VDLFTLDIDMLVVNGGVLSRAPASPAPGSGAEAPSTPGAGGRVRHAALHKAALAPHPGDVPRECAPAHRPTQQQPNTGNSLGVLCAVLASCADRKLSGRAVLDGPFVQADAISDLFLIA
jgi:hypothetical protein